jgi:hypothetical protein
MNMHNSSESTPKPVGSLVGKIWKDRSTKGKVGVVLGALLVLSVVASALGDSDPASDAQETSTEVGETGVTSSTETTSAPEVTSAPEETAPPEAATPSERLTEAVLKETGKSNVKGYGDRIQVVESSEEQTLVRLLGDENLTSGLTKSSNRRLVLEAITAYQSSGITSQFIAIEIYFPLVDNLGTEKLFRVLGYGFTQERIMAITPGNIDTKRMDENFADEFTFIHPSFRW